MTFKPEGFREFTPEHVGVAPPIRTSKLMTLILVAADGFATFANAVGDKEALIARKKPGDLLLCAWVGEWRTDVFIVTDENLKSLWIRK